MRQAKRHRQESCPHDSGSLLVEPAGLSRARERTDVCVKQTAAENGDRCRKREGEYVD